MAENVFSDASISACSDCFRTSNKSTQKHDPHKTIVYNHLRFTANKILYDEFFGSVDVSCFVRIATENAIMRESIMEMKKKLQQLKRNNLQATLSSKVSDFKCQVVEVSTFEDVDDNIENDRNSVNVPTFAKPQNSPKFTIEYTPDNYYCMPETHYQSTNENIHFLRMEYPDHLEMSPLSFQPDVPNNLTSANSDPLCSGHVTEPKCSVFQEPYHMRSSILTPPQSPSMASKYPIYLSPSACSGAERSRDGYFSYIPSPRYYPY